MCQKKNTGSAQSVLVGFLSGMLALFLSLVPSEARAATVTATGCDRTAVVNAINTAQSGDIVQVPGSCSSAWSSTITVPATKELWIRGGGIDSTVISNNSFDLTSNGTAQVRISNFTLSNTHPNTWGVNGDRQIIIDNNRITFSSGYDWSSRGMDTSPVTAFRHPTILIANNQLHNIRIYSNSTNWHIPPNGGSTASTDFQNVIWSQETLWGNAQYVLYIEGNTWDICNSSASYSCIDANWGGRYVARYNRVTSRGYIEQHSGGEDHRGNQRFEIYGNNLTASSEGRFGLLQGSGSGVVFDNLPPNGDLGIGNRRSSGGSCGGSSNYDQNTPGMNGYACRDQIGRAVDTVRWSVGAPYNQPLKPAYIWNNIKPGGSQMGWYLPNFGDLPDYQSVHLVPNRDFYIQSGTFNGTSGVGRGTWAARPTTCTNRVGYWATDRGGNWNTSNADANDGALYICNNNEFGDGTTAGVAYYTPYPYPHPLLNETPDTIPPTSPTGVSANAVSSSSITVSWTASTDNVGVAGYIVERCQGTGCSNFTQVATPTASPFVDSGLTAGTFYNYHVRARDAAGNLSGWSNVVGATTQAPDTQAPTAPSNLQAAVISSSNINLTWTASTDNVAVTGYRVERCQGSGCTSFTQIGTPTTNSYSDTGLSASTLYRYRVRATDAANNLSAYSGISEGTTPVAPPVSANLILGLNFSEGTGTSTQDVSGRNHTGTLSNATWTAGRNGGGVSFSGNSNSYIGIPTESDFDFTNNFTVSLWMKTASFGSAWASLVSKGDSSWSLTRFNTTNTLDFNSFSPSANDLQGTANVMNDVWHHIAIVYDGATKKIYVDGTVDAQASFTQTLSMNNFPVRIGGNAEYTSGAFNGSVDDVRIYNKALTQAEITTDMNTPLVSGGSTVACNTVTPANFSGAAYNSYGAPYDLFASNAQLVDAKCSSSDIRTINATIGKVGDTTRIVYTKGYYYDPGITNWAQYTSTCTGTLNGDWCAGPVTATITDADISTASASAPAYFVGMTCSVQGGSWRCGCRDTSCTNFYWQIQGAGQ